MPVFHVTLKFSTREHGWVEQFYRQDSNINAALRAAMELAAARYSILGAGVSLYQVRVSLPGAARASVSSPVTGTTLTTPAMLAYEGAEIRLKSSGSPSRNRTYFLRGLPHGSLVNPWGPARFSAQVANAADRWLGMLASGKWLMLVRNYKGPKYQISGIYPLPAPPAGVTLDDRGPPGPSPWESAVLVTTTETPAIPEIDPATGDAPTVRVGLARWTDLAAIQEDPVNGEWTLAGGLTIGLQYIGSAPRIGSYAGGGYAQIRQEGYAPIGSAVLVRQGIRHCGPPTVNASNPIAGSNDSFNPGQPESSPASAVVGPGYVIESFGGSITPGQPSPPTIPPVVIPPPPPDPPITLVTARQVGSLIYGQLTYSGEGTEYTPIGIAQIINLENTWWVGLAGTFSTEGSATGLLAAASAGLSYLNQYARIVRALILEKIPADAKILLNGFSLGGMTCENVASLLRSPNRVASIVTYASPITGIYWQSAPLVRFCCREDMVPTMTPLGFCSWLIGHPGYTIIPSVPSFERFPENHLNFPLSPGLDAYDCWGLPHDGRPPFVLGPLSRYRAPVLPV